MDCSALILLLLFKLGAGRLFGVRRLVGGDGAVFFFFLSTDVEMHK